ncbi:lysosomal cholesterol signaling protein [Culicoides brevitarsis]|uniref:lysosomal cholesterol signaling protein n=1 Tax=Culicoides brevitarsis TaxID=469753 RepID=UPI00307B210A
MNEIETIIGTNETEKLPNNSSDVNISMDNLYPALIQCFTCIIVGYFAGRLNIISNTEAKGLGTFVGNFALPSLIFLSLSELNWTAVNWTFLLSIFISKAIVFFSVIIISLLVIRPINLGKSGLLAIFSTQSNDFAIGYGLIYALYGTSHPEYASYIYLLAPISLALLNPIGYILLEITKIKQKNETANNTIVRCPQSHDNSNNSNVQRKLGAVLNTMKNIFFNPVLLMTLLGVFGGIIFPNSLPLALLSVLKVFGNSFSGTALFLLGIRMVGKAKTFQKGGFILPGILIIVKLLVLPIITRQTVNLMNAGVNFTDTTDLSTFGFLYGTFPAAPGVFVIASQYNQDIDLIGSSMILSTFVSAPLMFISAKMIAIHNLNPSDYMIELDKFALDISIFSIVAAIFVVLQLLISKKIKRMPYRITTCLVISQFIECIGVILWSMLGQNTGWRMVLQFCFFTIGAYSSRLWTAIYAVCLLFMECRSLCFVLKLWPAFVLIGWGIPTILVSILLIFDPDKNISEKRNPSFQYGNAQAAISVFILVMCFIVIVGCLVLHQRHKRIQEKYLSLVRDVVSDSELESPLTTASTSNLLGNAVNTKIPHIRSSVNIQQMNFNKHNLDTESSDDEIRENQKTLHVNTCCKSSTFEDNCSIQNNSHGVVDIEDLIPNDETTIVSEKNLCPSQYNCAGISRQNCKSIIKNYKEQNREGLEPLEDDSNTETIETMKHIVLLILLLCSMFVGLSISIWTLVMEGMSGIYVEITFLDAFLNFGQTLMVFAVFITDTGDMFSRIFKICKNMWCGSTTLNLPLWDELSFETKSICEQFTKHHLEHCRREIARNKRWRIQVYKNVFYGRDFVDWLVEVGLAKDRCDAVSYGKALIDGRIMRHTNNAYHFYDKNLLYTFCGRF